MSSAGRADAELPVGEQLIVEEHAAAVVKPEAVEAVVAAAVRDRAAREKRVDSLTSRSELLAAQIPITPQPKRPQRSIVTPVQSVSSTTLPAQ